MDKHIKHYLKKFASNEYKFFQGKLVRLQETATLIAIKGVGHFAIFSQKNQSDVTLNEYKYSYVESFEVNLAGLLPNGGRNRLKIFFTDDSVLEIDSASFPGKVFEILDNEKFIRTDAPIFKNSEFQEETQQRLKNADIFLNKNFCKEASKEYQKVLEKDSLNFSGHVGLIHAQICLNNIDVAEKIIARACNLFNTQKEVIYRNVARQFSQNQKPRKALEYFKTVFTGTPSENNFFQLAEYSLAANQDVGLKLLSKYIQVYPETFNKLLKKGKATKEQGLLLLSLIKQDFSNPKIHEHVIFIEAQSKSKNHHDAVKKWSESVAAISSSSTDTLDKALKILEESKILFREVELAVNELLKDEHKENIVRLEAEHKKLLFAYSKIKSESLIKESYENWIDDYRDFTYWLTCNKPKEVRKGIKKMWGLLNSCQDLLENGLACLQLHVKELIDKKHFSKANKINSQIVSLYGPDKIDIELDSRIKKGLKRRRLFLGGIILMIFGVLGYVIYSKWSEYQLFEQDKILYAQTYPDGAYFKEAEEICWNRIAFPALIVTNENASIKSRPLSTRRKHIKQNLSIGDTIYYRFDVNSTEWTETVEGEKLSDLNYRVSPSATDYNQNEGWIFGKYIQKSFFNHSERYAEYIETFPDGLHIEEAKNRYEKLKKIAVNPIYFTDDDIQHYLEEFPNGTYVNQLDSIFRNSIPTPTFICTSRKVYLRKEPDEDSRSIVAVRRDNILKFLNQKSNSLTAVKVGKNLVTDYYYRVSTQSEKGSIGWIFGGYVEPDFGSSINKYKKYKELFPEGIFITEVDRKLTDLEKDLKLIEQRNNRLK